jgi:general secretion pathway protein D
MNWRFDMPILDRRSIESKVKIWDGETVMMGGLIRERVTEVDDGIPYLRDIPLLGRLFENKGTISEKKNTIFLISTRIINSAGTPLRPSNLQGLPDFKRI